MVNEPKLTKTGSGCSIKRVKYKWRLTLPWNWIGSLNTYIPKSELNRCKGKFYANGNNIYFSDKLDAQYFYVRSFYVHD